MPIELPSKFGLTISGGAGAGPSRSSAACTSSAAGVRTPAAAARILVSRLSSVIAHVQGPEPV